jgi:uncharacterized membrane protein YccC
MTLAALLTRRRDEIRQAVRVMIGTALAYAAYKLLGLQQGYWAVFTVVIVMQGTIGGTLGAAVDRLIGTVAGAILCGIAILVLPDTMAGKLIGLMAVIGITSLAAAIRPQLRTGPITAAVLLLTHTGNVPAGEFVVDRVVEIVLGGVIGVLTSMFVFPAPSRAIALARTATLLNRLGQLLRVQADAVEQGEALSYSDQHAAVRKTLAGVEQAIVDADRERASRLTRAAVPDAVPRTLWRIRNGVAQVTRALDVPLPDDAALLQQAVAALMRADAAFLDRCGAAVQGGTRVERGTIEADHVHFDQVFGTVRGTGMIRALSFDGASRIFGIAFTLDRLHQDMRDLADRIDEMAGGKK